MYGTPKYMVNPRFLGYSLHCVYLNTGLDEYVLH